MLQTVLSRIGWFVLLVFLQALVFNHIHLFGYATPMPYIYFLLILPASTPRWCYPMSGFLLGLSVDLFINTPGMTAASLCACAMLVPLFRGFFTPADEEDEDFRPSAKTMKWPGFITYSALLTILHCFLFHAIESFTVSEWSTTLLSAGCSFLITMVFIAVFEIMRTSRKS